MSRLLHSHSVHTRTQIRVHTIRYLYHIPRLGTFAPYVPSQLPRPLAYTLLLAVFEQSLHTVSADARMKASISQSIVCLYTHLCLFYRDDNADVNVNVDVFADVFAKVNEVHAIIYVYVVAHIYVWAYPWV